MVLVHLERHRLYAYSIVLLKYLHNGVYSTLCVRYSQSLHIVANSYALLHSLKLRCFVMPIEKPHEKHLSINFFV